MKTESPRSFPNSPCSRKKFRPGWWSGCLLIVACLVGLAGQVSAQSYGPPKILYQGFIANYAYPGTVNDGSGTPADVYDNGITYGSDGRLYDSGGNLLATGFGNQSGGSQYFALAADGVTFLNLPPGVILYAQNQSDLTNVSYGGYSTPIFWNGFAWEMKYIPWGDSYFQIGSSPWYWFSSNTTSDIVMDIRNGWPNSNVVATEGGPGGVSTVFTPPPQVWINGEIYNLATTTVSSSGYYMTQSYFYEGPMDNGYIQIDVYYVYGVSANFGSSVSGNISGSVGPTNIWFSNPFDTYWLQWQGNIPEYVAMSFLPPSSNVSAPFPSMIYWDGSVLPFYGENDQVYWLGDSNGVSLFTVVFGFTSATIPNAVDVFATHGGNSITGTYDLVAKTFNFSGAPDSANFFALDQYGNPYPGTLPPGITLLFGSNGPGQQIMQRDGTVSTPTYHYQRPDGSWASKYTNLPDGVYLVQDENGNYTAPPYQFQAALGDTTVNAISGWPATNLYPQQLYINGIACALVAGSQYDSGAGFPRNGGASYRASAYDLTVVLSWNWDTSTGFQGFVTGKYGQSSSFRGSWDGLGNFSNMTNGAIASVTAPTTVPTDGNPPQIAVNGTALQYNSLASTALSNAGTPGDVYTGSLGQTLTIYSNGTTSFTPGAGGTAISGTYNAATHQFSFGTGGNSVTVTNSDGSSSNAVITATDTGGHNLATPIGGATNGNGVTELAGGLDIRGNTLTLGSWTTGNESVFGLGIAYGDAVSGSGSTAQLNLSTTRAAVNWNWIHPSADGGSDQVTAMQLGATHRVLVYDPTQTGSVGIVLDPSGANGNTGVSGTIRVWQRGDIPMGQYVNGTQPPVPNGSGN